MKASKVSNNGYCQIPNQINPKMLYIYWVDYFSAKTIGDWQQLEDYAIASFQLALKPTPT